jgi:hypothetical protein
MDSLDKYYLLGIAIAALAGVPGVSEATNNYFAHGYGTRGGALPVLHQDAMPAGFGRHGPGHQRYQSVEFHAELRSEDTSTVVPVPLATAVLI